MVARSTPSAASTPNSADRDPGQRRLQATGESSDGYIGDINEPGATLTPLHPAHDGISSLRGANTRNNLRRSRLLADRTRQGFFVLPFAAKSRTPGCQDRQFQDQQPSGQAESQSC